MAITVEATINVGIGPDGVSCDETLEKAFVSNYTDGTVSVISGYNGC